MATFNDLSTSQLRQALDLSEQIDSLQEKLKSLLGGAAEPAPKTAAAPAASAKTRKGMSPATRAKMRAAQQARWAKIKGPGEESVKPAAAAPAKKTRRGLTPEGRAKLAAAMKARWAARKTGAPAPNAAAH
jgi:hypothetical protein